LYSGKLSRQVVETFLRSPMFLEMRMLHESLVSLTIDRVVTFLSGSRDKR